MNETQIEQAAEARIQSGLTWIQRHERILIVALVLTFGSWFGNHWLNIKAAADNRAAIIAEKQLDDQKAKDAQLAAQLAQLGQQYQVALRQLSAQNAQLTAAMTNRTVVLRQQQATDKTLPLPDLGKRWSDLADVPTTDITASTSGFTVSDTAARATVEKLESVPVLTQNLKDETTIADNRQSELDKANGLITGLNNQVTNLNMTIADDDKACTSKVSAVKSQARTEKRNWFLRGLAAGASLAAYFLK
jgi:hypothetical protein